VASSQIRRAWRLASLGDALQGSLRGYLGFDEYAGPGFQVVNAHAQIWALASGDQDSLIAGRETSCTFARAAWAASSGSC